jgi:molybdate transport system regulatory protein
MPADQPEHGADWKPGVRVCIERAGQLLLGKGRLDLLDGIERWRSISAAARQMGMSYRRAWELVQQANEAAGTPLVEAAPGGAHGGGARLTPFGRWALGVYRSLCDGLDHTAGLLLQRLLTSAEPAPLHVVAASSLADVLVALLADFAAVQPTISVRVIHGASDELADGLLAGGPGDLFLSADPARFELLQASGLLTTAPVALAGNTLAVIAACDNPLTLRGPSDLRSPVVGRIALARPGCPLGAYTRAWLEQRRLAGEIEERMVLVDNARAVVTAVCSRLAEVGIVYGSDAARAEGCRCLLPIHRLPRPIRYAGAVLERGHDRTPARLLLDFLMSGPARWRFREFGFPLPRAGG